MSVAYLVSVLVLVVFMPLLKLFTPGAPWMKTTLAEACQGLPYRCSNPCSILEAPPQHEPRNEHPDTAVHDGNNKPFHKLDQCRHQPPYARQYRAEHRKGNKKCIGNERPCEPIQDPHSNPAERGVGGGWESGVGAEWQRGKSLPQERVTSSAAPFSFANFDNFDYYRTILSSREFSSTSRDSLAASFSIAVKL